VNKNSERRCRRLFRCLATGKIAALESHIPAKLNVQWSVSNGLPFTHAFFWAGFSASGDLWYAPQSFRSGFDRFVGGHLIRRISH
jgi:hypothetical protein